MACFTACVAEALIVYGVKKTIDHSNNNGIRDLASKLFFLVKLLLGGSFLLLIEHVWHGEIVPYYPFLTAASNPDDFNEMLHEIMTVGLTMDVVITTFWFVACILPGLVKRRSVKA
ncbi:MAG: hypothetical protein ACI4NE_07685 [Succinivibrio sp.]